MTKGYGNFVSQLDDVVMMYPKIKRVEVNGIEILKGNISIIDENGKHWDDYDIEIHASDNFPGEFPLLFETSKKIPRIADWHIYEDTFSCCVKVRPEEIIRCKQGITLIDYIKEEVFPYFFNQSYRRQEGHYANGEYSHGALGIYEYYSKLLGTKDDIKRTVQLMIFIASNELPGRTSMCFCGNGKKFRNCHKSTFKILKQVGNEQLLSDANIFMTATRN